MNTSHNAKSSNYSSTSKNDCGILASASHPNAHPPYKQAKYGNHGKAITPIAPIAPPAITTTPAVATPPITAPVIDPAAIPAITDPVITSATTPATAIQPALQLTIPAPQLTPEVKTITDQGMSWIGVDTDTDGLGAIESSKGIKFDIANTGIAQNVGWISGNDDLLCIDLNGNGKIDNGSELFGGSVGQGFAKLGTYDTNRDGFIDAKDSDFGKLSVWNDANSNALTDPNELRSLSAAGISSIDLKVGNSFGIAGNNLVFGESTTAMSKDGSIAVTEVYFA